MHVTTADDQAATQAVAVKKLLTRPADGFAICPVRDILDRVGDKWSLLCVMHLGTAERMRFNELRREVAGISQRMLTVTLRSLETDGLVRRTVFAEVPPRVEYCLTELGRSLLGAFIELGHWAAIHAPAIVQARERAAGKAAGE